MDKMAQVQKEDRAATVSSILGSAWRIGRENAWLYLVISALKLLVIPAYRSTDYEVHRNWMSITWNKPLNEWYTESTSQWTLDYPPLFGMFELFWAAWARLFAPEALQISASPIDTPRLLLFHRASVVACDIVLYAGLCVLLASRQQKTHTNHTRLAILLTMANAGLFIVDNVHFQYNGYLLGLLLASLGLMECGLCVSGCALYSLLLLHKHLFAFAGPAYVVALLRHIIYAPGKGGTRSRGKAIRDAILACTLALSIIVLTLLPFALSSPSPSAFMQALHSRLFPFNRGLVHSYWAPNVWALLLTGEKIIFAVMKRVLPSAVVIMPLSAVITPTVCIALTALLDAIIMYNAVRSSSRVSYHQLAALFYLAAFLFGWHTHEKGIIYVLVPLIPFVDDWPLGRHGMNLLVLASQISLLPLLFTPREQILAIAAVAAYQCLVLSGSPKGTARWHELMCYLVLASTLAFYFLHRLIAPAYEFAHLMCISIATATVIVIAAMELTYKILQMK